jgi:hypothetical protein
LAGSLLAAEAERAAAAEEEEEFREGVIIIRTREVRGSTAAASKRPTQSSARNTLRASECQ